MNFVTEWIKVETGCVKYLIHHCRSFIHPKNNKIYVLYCRSFIKHIWDFCFWHEINGVFVDFETLKNDYKLINKNLTVYNIAERLLYERFN